jgi:hypothetical protein
MIRIKKMIRFISTIMALGLPLSAMAQDAVLTVSNSETGETIALSEADLKALPQSVIHTENEFVDSITAFEGPLARDVLALLGTEAETVKLTAVNDYAVEVPMADFISYDVVFAMSADGVPFSRRDKGPIWVIYPMSDHAELQDPVFNARLIWQLVKVETK